MSARTSGSWHSGCVKGKKPGKVRSVKDAMKINLSSPGSEESLRLLDGAVEWFREIKLAK